MWNILILILGLAASLTSGSNVTVNPRANLRIGDYIPGEYIVMVRNASLREYLDKLLTSFYLN